MRPRWHRERDGISMDKAVYASSKSKTAAAYGHELTSFHDEFCRKHRKTLDELLGLFQQPRKRIRRDSQSSLCTFFQILEYPASSGRTVYSVEGLSDVRQSADMAQVVGGAFAR